MTTTATYLMNDIPRGTTSQVLVSTVFPPPAELVSLPIIEDSRLDDDESVTTLVFKTTPEWLAQLGTEYFRHPTDLGTIWGGVNTNTDDSGQPAFIRAVIAGNVKLAELLAEFSSTDLNVKDSKGWTALHWACHSDLFEMTEFCLTLPGLDSGQTCLEGLTPFDVAFEKARGSDNDSLPALFYTSVFAMETHDPQGALLRLITLTEPNQDRVVFPGEALFDPAEDGNVPLVNALLTRGVNVTATNEKKETALHLAAKNGHAEVAASLLEIPSRGLVFDGKAVAEGNLTALHYAAQKGSPETVRVLMRLGSNTEAMSNDGQTALHYAAQHDSPETLLVLMQLGGNMDAKDKTGNTPLDRVAQNGHQSMPQLTKILLNPAADLEERDSEGRTAWDVAVRDGRVEVMQFLLDRGARIERTTFGNHTALIHAAESGQLEVVRLLLDRGANIEADGGRSGRALIRAATTGRVEVVRLLLDRGANIESEYSFGGQTALYWAASHGKLEVLKLLLDRGAKVDPPGVVLQTPLARAAQYGGLQAVRLLLDHGATIDGTNNPGVALRGAVWGGKLEVVRLLVDRGAEINARLPDYGETALHIASKSRKLEIVRFLLQKGADRTIQNTDGKRPADMTDEQAVKDIFDEISS